MVTLDPAADGVMVTVSGALADVTDPVTRQGRTWCTATLRTAEHGPVPLNVYPATYAACTRPANGQTVTVTGRVDWRSGALRLLTLRLHQEHRSVSTSTPVVISTHNGSTRGRV